MSHFAILKAGNATTDAGDIEVEFGVLSGKFDELIDVGFDGFHATLHGGDGIALSLQSHSLASNGTESVNGGACRTAHVHAVEVAAEDEHLVVAQ